MFPSATVYFLCITPALLNLQLKCTARAESRLSCRPGRLSPQWVFSHCYVGNSAIFWKKVRKTHYFNLIGGQDGFTPGYRTGQKFELDPWGTYPGGVFKIKVVLKRSGTNWTSGVFQRDQRSLWWPWLLLNVFTCRNKERVRNGCRSATNTDKQIICHLRPANQFDLYIASASL